MHFTARMRKPTTDLRAAPGALRASAERRLLRAQAGVRPLHAVAALLIVAGAAIATQQSALSKVELAAGTLAAAGIAAIVARLERRLSRARTEADLDPLTGSLNRAAFARLAGERLSCERPRDGCGEGRWGMVMVDLDDFGLLNKRRGHLEGDRLLCLSVRHLSDAVGDEGLLGRLGGDELAALVPASKAEEIGHSALRRLLSDREPISASVGVAVAHRGHCDWVALLREADVALRSAKRNGKGRLVVFAEGIDAAEQLTRRHIQEAIDGDAIEIFVQPIVDLASGAARAYEALARFRCAGPASPAHWLSMAEPVGMRVELEIACLRRSLELLKDLPEGARLSVNLSALALHDPRVRRLLRESAPERLIVELTEEGLVQDARGLRSDLQPLLSCGLELAVDDMGAGYSNLRQVVELSPSLLKLDRTLVHGIDRDPSQRLLIDALTGYAERTGAEIVAEGIETESELEVVRALGISCGQGYLLSMPGPPWPAVSISGGSKPASKAPTHGSRPVTIPVQMTAEQARRRFVALPELECLVIVGDEERPLALITRHRLLTVLGHRFGYALWGERPVMKIADSDCLRLPIDTPVDQLARLSLARPVERRHDPLLLIDADGRLAGQVTMSDLLLWAGPGRRRREGERTGGRPAARSGAAHRLTSAP